MDVFNESYWNLIQTLGWVYRRDPEWVCRASDEVTDHGTFPQEMQLPDGRVELVESPANPLNDRHLEIAAALTGGAAYQTVNDAENALLGTLRNGHLNALGLENNMGDLLEIPLAQWAGLKFYFGPSRAGPLNIARVGATHWHDLKFSRSEVLEIWPDPFQSVEDQTRPEMAERPERDPKYTLELKEDRSPGRPSYKKQIKKAYQILADTNEIDFNASKTALYKAIRGKACDFSDVIIDAEGRLKGFDDETIRRVATPLFEAGREKAQRQHSKEPSKTPSKL